MKKENDRPCFICWRRRWAEISKNSNISITTSKEEINDEVVNPQESLEEMYRKIQRMSDPAYLHTVTLDELMDNVFEVKSAVIENLLYTGAYILAGAPKIGKSFLVAQIAHYVSTGQDLWGYKVHQGTVLYLALEMTKAVCSAGCSACSVWRGQALSTLLPAPR